jgi:hypothetical protein
MVLGVAPHQARWCSMRHFCCALAQYAAANCLTLIVRDSTKFFTEEIFEPSLRSGAMSYQR